MRTLVAFSVIVLASLAGYSYASSPRVGSVEDLSFNIALDRESSNNIYPPGEAPRLTLTLTNSRLYPIYIERDFTLGRTVMISVYKGDSRYATRVIPTTLTTKGCADFMSREVNPYAQFTEVVLLEPGASVSVTLDLGRYQWYNTDTIGWWNVEFIDWTMPGSYSVDVLYVQRWCSRVTPFTSLWKWVGRTEFTIGGAGR